ncbi:MAG TPA: hypothetical protein VFP59_00360 [Candidatus Angelobacter sp.]|nr:hypothetical protein [Candidatus Angelobacter sp.]
MEKTNLVSAGHRTSARKEEGKDTAHRRTTGAPSGYLAGLSAMMNGSPTAIAQRLLDAEVRISPVVQAQLRTAESINRQPSAPATEIVQRNAFLDQLSDAARQIDYVVISGGGATANQTLLYQSISEAVEKNRKRQAMFEGLEQAGLGAQFEAYAQGKNWTLGNLVSAGQDIRSSHSGGAIDPNLPQAAYQAAPVAGGGLTVSVAPPALNTLGERANYAWLSDSTTKHTTDPDAPEFRGPTSPGALPTLGSTVGGGIGANNRLASAPGRVASYFELGAGTIHSSSGATLVSGTRVVYDPFNRRYFISEHYAQQYELTNVPAPSTHALHGQITNGLTTIQQDPRYIAANPAARQRMIEKNLFDKLLDRLMG